MSNIYHDEEPQEPLDSNYPLIASYCFRSLQCRKNHTDSEILSVSYSSTSVPHNWDRIRGQNLYPSQQNLPH